MNYRFERKTTRQTIFKVNAVSIEMVKANKNNVVIKMTWTKRLPELQFLILCTVCCYAFLELFITPSQLSGFSGLSSVDLILLSFLLSVLVAIISVIAGSVAGLYLRP